LSPISISAWVGIDWADNKHDIVLRPCADPTKSVHRVIENKPEAIADWIIELQQLFGSQGKSLWSRAGSASACSKKAKALTDDAAVIEPAVLRVQMLAQQLKSILPYIARHEQQIAQLFDSHPDSFLFRDLPGAGSALAPRLLTAFGTERDRFTQAIELGCLSGIAPVRKASGKSSTTHMGVSFVSIADEGRSCGTRTPERARKRKSLGRRGSGAIPDKWMFVLAK
jgi:transposase